ncbi:MAG: hypothetical protein ABI158_13295, partial [Edaphobacter sp.]
MIVLLVTGSATGVHASTDCERWFIAYKHELAQSQAVKRLRAAKARARRYARMKLAGYVKPKPVARPRRHYPRRPKMSRAELMRRLELACGVLPERMAAEPVIREENLEDFMPHRAFAVPMLTDSGDEPLIALLDPPRLPLTGVTPDTPTYGMPPMYTPPFGGGYPPGILPPPGLPPPPPVTPVPEPESL